ncbi:hypothetical protein IWQ62_002291 [Dispira parvispora]|uniref:Zn(2)-C6 fungal-type domain-containing protein n=1 Tax=Dispira parvispora TaxID=1520584 RepID=A0A9W8E2V0_9FUNG|nr:hypothetical protein IWQ62_002291 [Dispira parvispora]
MDSSEIVKRRFTPRQNIPVCQPCIENNMSCDGNVPSCRQCESVHKVCFFSTRPALKANLNTAAPAGAFMVSSTLVRTDLYQESDPMKTAQSDPLDDAPVSGPSADATTESVPQDDSSTAAPVTHGTRRKQALRSPQQAVIKKAKGKGESRFDFYRTAKQYYESWLLFPMRTSTDNLYQKYFICHEQKRLSYQATKHDRDLEVARSLAKLTAKDIRYYIRDLSCLSTEIPSLTAPKSTLPPADHPTEDGSSDTSASSSDVESTSDMAKISTKKDPLPPTLSTKPIFVDGLPDEPRYTILVPKENPILDGWDATYGPLLAQPASSSVTESTMDDPLPDSDLLHSLHGTAIEFFDRLKSGHMDKKCTPAALLCLGVMMQEYTDYLLHSSGPRSSPPSPVIKMEYDSSDVSTDYSDG